MSGDGPRDEHKPSGPKSPAQRPFCADTAVLRQTRRKSMAGQSAPWHSARLAGRTALHRRAGFSRRAPPQRGRRRTIEGLAHPAFRPRQLRCLGRCTLPASILARARRGAAGGPGGEAVARSHVAAPAPPVLAFDGSERLSARRPAHEGSPSSEASLRAQPHPRGAGNNGQSFESSHRASRLRPRCEFGRYGPPKLTTWAMRPARVGASTPGGGRLPRKTPPKCLLSTGARKPVSSGRCSLDVAVDKRRRQATESGARETRAEATVRDVESSARMRAERRRGGSLRRSQGRRLDFTKVGGRFGGGTHNAPVS